MIIDIANLQSKYRISKREIVRCAEVTLRHFKIKDAELSIAFVDDKKIRLLNKKYLNKNRVTDVLAFSMREGKFDPGCNVLGDVIISVETALREAKNRKIPVSTEISLYIIHGILHILGYDDMSFVKRTKMRGKEREILALL